MKQMKKRKGKDEKNGRKKGRKRNKRKNVVLFSLYKGVFSMLSLLHVQVYEMLEDVSSHRV